MTRVPGRGASAIDTCTTCDPGFGCPEGTGTPQRCKPGFFSLGAQGDCTPCPGGTYGEVSGATSEWVCIACGLPPQPTMKNYDDSLKKHHCRRKENVY